MAAITVAAKGAGMTLAAASGGGDTVAVAAGTKAGGWMVDGTPVLVVTVGATPSVVTVDGVAQASLTSQTLVVPLPTGVYGRSVAVTYSSVTAVTVGACIL